MVPEELVAVAEAWPKMTAGKMSPNHCILATRVLARLWRDDITPIPTMALFANARAWPLLGTIGGRRLEEVDPLAWTVAVDPAIPSAPGRYGAHLVALYKDRWMVDLSAQQFDRPTRGIRVKRPVIIDMDAADHPDSDTFGPGSISANLRDLGVGIGMCIYAPAANAPQWRHSADWSNAANTDPYVSLLRRLTGS